MYRLLFVIAVATSCDPGVSAEFRVNTTGHARDNVTVRAIATSQRLASRYGLLVFRPATDYCQLLSATGSDRVRGQSVMLRLCIGRVDSTQIRITLGEAITMEWGPRGDSLRGELRDSLSHLFGSAFDIR